MVADVRYPFVVKRSSWTQSRALRPVIVDHFTFPPGKGRRIQVFKRCSGSSVTAMSCEIISG